MPHYECPGGKLGPAVRPTREPDDEQCGSYLDVGCQAGRAINGWFRKLVKSGLAPTLDLLRHSVLATPDIDGEAMQRPRQLWSASLLIADACFVLLVTLGGVLIMSGQLTVTEYAIKDIVSRIVFAFIIANTSLILLRYAIRFANGLAGAFLAIGQSKISPRQAADSLSTGIAASIDTAGIFLVLVLLVALILIVAVIMTYLVRLALIMLLIAAAPLALILHALPQTEGIALLWWRSISGLLAIQVCQSLTLVTAATVLFTSEAHDARKHDTFVGLPTGKHDLVDALLLICLLYVLLRIPSWVASTIWRPGRPSMLGRVIRSYLAYKTLGLLTAGRIGGHRGTRPTRRPRRGGGPSAGRTLTTSAMPGRDRRPPRATPPSSHAPSGSPQRGTGTRRRPAPRSSAGTRTRGRQLSLDLDLPPRPQPPAPPKQLALFPTPKRVNHPPRPAPPAGKPTPRSRQLMLPNMPKRPVPPRQLPLRLDPPPRKVTRSSHKEGR